MAERPLAMSWHNGRLVSSNTLWWWKNTDMAYDQLFCMHDRRLSEECKKCKEKEEA